jgi:hypothetical protein
MDQAQVAKTPVHLWIVGFVSLLWNAFGGYDYIMTRTRNTDYLSSAMPGVDPKVMLDYIDSFPMIAQIGWGLGVWGAVLGSILLLMRSRHAVLAFALSFLGIILSIGYQLAVAPPPAELNQGAMAYMPWFIILVGLALLYYSHVQKKKGVLR